MTNKEISIRSIVFLIIGILLVLSLVICINIVNGEKDLVATNATVIKIKEDKDGTGKNDITAVYDVGNTTYQYNFYYKDDVKIDDEIKIYYHEKDVTSVQVKKTPKLIFIFPIIGIVLCVFGLFELFSKQKDFEKIVDENDEKIKFLDEDDKTKTFKIINTQEKSNYTKTEEEIAEVPVRNIKEKKKSISSKETPEIKNKIIPSEYKINNDKIIYKEIGKENQELLLDNISKVIKTINANKELIKVTIKENNNIYIFTNMNDIKVNKFAEDLHNKLKEINKDILEEIEYKEW